MKLLRFTFLSLLLLAALAVGWVVVSGMLRKKHWREHPDLAFQEITGRALPRGVEAVGFTSEMNDALFRSTYYWMLRGDREKLIEVSQQLRLVANAFTPQDAQNLQHRFDVPDTGAKVTAHFASRDDGTDHDPAFSLYYILENGTAFYAR